MLTENIDFKNFKIKKDTKLIKKKLNLLLKEDNQIIKSLSNNYKNSFKKKNISKYKKFINYRIIGMGGSILGTKAAFKLSPIRDRVSLSFSFKSC